MNCGHLLHTGDRDEGGPWDWHAMLDPYLDGTLSREQAAAFEARLRTDGALRASLDAQRAIDASIRAQFEVPAAASTATLGAGRVAVGRSILARVGWLRIAALVAIAALGVLVLAMRLGGLGAYPTESPTIAYRAIVAGGFRPYEVCTDDTEFANYTSQSLGKALAVEQVPGLVLVGWDNTHHVLSLDTDTLLATVDGSQVVVFMDRAENARRLPSDDYGLNVFRRSVAGIELVEVSPLSEAKILPHFGEWTKSCGDGKPRPSP
ncbi:MAG: hypothetical protein U0637_14925 [Phycisphaerales bacterium]